MVSLGLITVSTAGTPVRLSTSTLYCNQINFQPMAGPTTANTGNVYIGFQGMNKSTLAGVIYVLAPGIPAATVLGSPAGAANDQVGNYWIDADNASDGVLVSYA